MIKNAKNDTRYIIKRILIGVGIALILGFLKANNVFADSPSNLYLNYFGYNLPDITTSPWGGSDNSVYDFNYSNYKFNINSVSDSFYYLLFKDNENYYIISSNSFSCGGNELDNFTGDILFSSSNITYNYNNSSCSSDSVYFFELRTLSINNLSSSFVNELTNNLDYVSFYNTNYNNDFYYNIFVGKDNYDSTDDNGVLYAYNLLNYFYNNYDLVSTSTGINFYLDNELLVPDDLPSNYATLDLTDYNAVYFLPKDYSTIPTHEVDDHIFIDFPFYFKGAVNYGYFNLVNNEQIVFLPLFNNLSSSVDFTFVESSFPMFYDDTDSNLDDLNSFIIYNIGGVTQVAYNNNLFDYYLIKDLNSYSQEITYIDNLGNSVTKTITFTQTLEEMWESGFSQDSNNWWNAGFKNKDKLNNYIQLLKLPYRLFVLLYNKIIGGMCTDFIIPFPHLGNIRVTCLSVVFRNVLGNNFFSAFKILINTFYVIAIVFANVKFLMKQLSPELIWFGNNL